MARILPNVAKGFGPIVPQRQRFMMKKQSDEDKALKIIQAISGGVGTAAQLYKVGSDIYDKYIKETPEEALRRRQEELGDAEARQNVARSVLAGVKGAERLDKRPFEEAQKELAQDYDMAQYRRMRLGEKGSHTVIPGLESRLDRFTEAVFVPPAEGEVRTRKPVPFKETPEGALDYLGTPAEAAAPAPATTALDESEVIGDLGKLDRLLPQYAAQRGMNVAETRKMLRDGDFRRRDLAPGSTETFRQYLDRMQQSGQFGGTPPAPQQQAPAAADPVMVNFEEKLKQVVQKGGPDLAEHFVKRSERAAAEHGRPDLAGQFRAALAKLGGPEAAAFEFIEQRGQRGLLDRPRTAAEFARGFEAGEDFAVADLNMAYRSLWNAGRQQEAEELVNLAGATMDFGKFAKSGNEPRSLILARARQAIRQGVDEGGVTGTQAVKLATSAAKRRRRRATPGGVTKRSVMTGPLTEEEKGNRSFVIVAGFDGLSAARKTLYGKKSGDPSTKQSRLSARARAIEREVTQEELNRLTITSGGEEILLSELFSNIGKTRKTQTTAKTERDKLTDSIQARQDRLSRVIGLRPSALTAEAVQSWLNANKPLSDLTETQYINTQILGYPEDRKDQAISNSALAREGLTKAKASALYQKLKQDVNDVRVDLDRLDQEEAKLQALKAPK